MDGWICPFQWDEKFLCPAHHHPLFPCAVANLQADEGVTLRTRKFITNRLLNRKQFVPSDPQT